MHPFGELSSQRRRLGDALRTLRAEIGLTGEQLAGRLGVSQSRISRIELGQQAAPADLVRRWAEVTKAQEDHCAELVQWADAASTELYDATTGTVASDFTDVTTRRPAPLGTEGRILYDAHHLYVGMRNEQPGVPITATQSTNDVGAGLDDAVSVSIDTSGSGSRQYTFTVTPRGVRYATSSESNRFAPPWEARTHVDGTTWTAELVIPFDALRAENREKQTWRINLTRHVAAVQEDYSWAYDPAAQSVTDATTWPALLVNVAGNPPSSWIHASKLADGQNCMSFCSHWLIGPGISV